MFLKSQFFLIFTCHQGALVTYLLPVTGFVNKSRSNEQTLPDLALKILQAVVVIAKETKSCT